jgi:phosphatidylserine/phosphatidylglycerophosphate/cardiolipin synthase-like enzyme
MTVIGSSNFSFRSNRRDTECQLYIVPECEDFKKRMHEECEHLFSHSKKMAIESIKYDGTDKLTLTERLLNRVLKILL